MQHFVAFIWVFTVCQNTGTHLVKWLNIHKKLSVVAQDEGCRKAKASHGQANLIYTVVDHTIPYMLPWYYAVNRKIP